MPEWIVRPSASCAFPLPRGLAQFPSGLRLGAEILEPSVRQRLPDAPHQLLIITDVGKGQEHHAEKLARFHQMMNIGAGVIARRGARAAGIERCRILRMDAV